MYIYVSMYHYVSIYLCLSVFMSDVCKRMHIFKCFIFTIIYIYMYFHIYIHNYICLGIGYIKPPYASIHCTIHIQIHMPTSPAASPVIPRSICGKAPRNAGRESAPARSFVQVLQVLASGVGLLVGLVTVRTVGWWISMDINGYTWIQMRSTQVPYGLKNHLRTSAHPMESPFSNSECFLRALYQWHLLLGDGVTNVGIADLSVANPIPLHIK